MAEQRSLLSASVLKRQRTSTRSRLGNGPKAVVVSTAEDVPATNAAIDGPQPL